MPTTLKSADRILLFLDLDDVLCLNRPYGGYDVMQALSQVQKHEKAVIDFPEMWATLFEPAAVAHLTALHEEFKPIYCLSTSWTRLMNRAAMVATLHQTGLRFVVDNLHEDWETPKTYQATRSDEIRGWLTHHPEFKNRWVAVDDEYSGTGFKSRDAFVVLCATGKGLTDQEYQKLRMVFAGRRQNGGV